jgi:ABC-type dipeptide/oligopeptide/nickel transport system ATPase component
MIARQNKFSEDIVTGDYVSNKKESPYYKRHVLPKRDKNCQYCGASMWLEEKLAKSSPTKPIFGLCCLSGTVSLPEFKEYPDELYKFITGNSKESKEFINAIRLYNSILAFTSVSCNVDESLLSATSGVYTFRINGTVHHKISNFMPEDKLKAKFGQIYIYDSDLQSLIRQQMFPKAIRASILNLFQDYLIRVNPYVHIYQQAGKTMQKDPSASLNIVLKSNTSKDKTKNLPTANEVAVLIVDNGETKFSKRDVVVSKLNPQNDYPLKFVNENLSMYDPLAYPLIHLFGEPGWQFQTYPKKSKKDLLLEMHQATQPLNINVNIRDTDGLEFNDLIEENNNQEFDQNSIDEAQDFNSNLNKNGRYVTAREFYAYRFMDRDKSVLQYFGRLYHQYIVDNYAKIELGRLNFIRHNQSKLRVERYQGLFDAMNSEETLNANQIGKVYVLPSSFSGGPRSMEQAYQDSMAAIRVHGKPDLFVTMTTNPQWPEILNELKEGQTPNDRPDLIARVFKLKLKALMDDVLHKHILGVPIAHVYVIEFQKRGLPHAHILIVLREQDKIITPDQVDATVSAEIPDKEEYPLAYQTVTNSLMHGPCGPQFPKAPCMVNGHCSKGFPKPFQNETYLANDR